MKKSKLLKKEVSKENKSSKSSEKNFSLSSKVFFLTYKGISENGQKITKNQLVKYLLEQNPNNFKLRPEKYLVCQQTYLDGTPHFHAILCYSRRKQILNSAFFDYKTIHPNIQTMRNMKAALEYVCKEDPTPYTNMDLIQQKRIAKVQHSSSIYQFLRQQMMKDPFNFDVFSYCTKHDLDRQVYKANYTKAVNLLKNVQQAYCNKVLFQKPGFKFIDRPLIQSKLSPSELKTFDSWGGYQIIVNYLNQVPLYGNKRQMKTKNLLITGQASIGKTSLFHNPNHKPDKSCIEDYCAVYHMGMSTWFPLYRSGVYHMILWNEAKLTSYSYDTVLKLLEGSYVDLPVKGGVAPKRDNPLIVLTSNMTLEQMILQKFHYSKSLQDMARSNLSVRIQNVVVPQGYDLFLLQKLFVKF